MKRPLKSDPTFVRGSSSFLPCARWLSSLIFFWTSALVNRAVVDRERAVQPQLVHDVLVAGRDFELGVQVEAAGHRRLRRFHGELHDVFEPALGDLDVERHDPALHALDLVDAAGRDERGLQKLRVDPIERGVAVGGIDRRVVGAFSGTL